MAGTRLPLNGEGTWVTGLAIKQGSTIRVLLVNFDATGSHTEAVPIRIANLPNGTYVYNQQYLQGIKPTEAVSQQESVMDGTLTKHLFLPAQSVVLLELIKRL